MGILRGTKVLRRNAEPIIGIQVPEEDEFKYWEVETWVKYLREDVSKLYFSSKVLKGLWDEIYEISHNKKLSQLIRERGQCMERIFTEGTVDPDSPLEERYIDRGYPEGSLATAYMALLGTKVNLKEYHFLKRLGQSLDVICKVDKPEIMVYIDAIGTLTGRAIEIGKNKLGLIDEGEIMEKEEECREKIEDILNNPEKIVEALVDFLDKGIGLLIPYNSRSRFIWNLRKITKDCINKLYPKLTENRTFEEISKILGLMKYIEPRTDNEEINRMFTLYSYDYAVDYRVESCKIKTVHLGNGYYSYEWRVDYESLREGKAHLEYQTIGGCISQCIEMLFNLFSSYTSERKIELFLKEVPQPESDWREEIKRYIPEVRSALGITGECITRLRFEGYKLPTLDNFESIAKLNDCMPEILFGVLEPIIVGDRIALYERLF